MRQFESAKNATTAKAANPAAAETNFDFSEDFFLIFGILIAIWIQNNKIFNYQFTLNYEIANFEINFRRNRGNLISKFARLPPRLVKIDFPKAEVKFPQTLIS
jgi:hypothetical protein